MSAIYRFLNPPADLATQNHPCCQNSILQMAREYCRKKSTKKAALNKIRAAFNFRLYQM